MSERARRVWARGAVGALRRHVHRSPDHVGRDDSSGMAVEGRNRVGRVDARDASCDLANIDAIARQSVLPDPERAAVRGDDRVAVRVDRHDSVPVAGIGARRAVAMVSHGAARGAPHHHAVVEHEHRRSLARSSGVRTVVSGGCARRGACRAARRAGGPACSCRGRRRRLPSTRRSRCARRASRRRTGASVRATVSEDAGERRGGNALPGAARCVPTLGVSTSAPRRFSCSTSPPSTSGR